MAKKQKVARQPVAVKFLSMRELLDKKPDSPLAAERDVFVIRVNAKFSRDAEDLAYDLDTKVLMFSKLGIKILSVSKEVQA